MHKLFDFFISHKKTIIIVVICALTILNAWFGLLVFSHGDWVVVYMKDGQILIGKEEKRDEQFIALIHVYTFTEQNVFTGTGQTEHFQLQDTGADKVGLSPLANVADVIHFPINNVDSVRQLTDRSLIKQLRSLTVSE